MTRTKGVGSRLETVGSWNVYNVETQTTEKKNTYLELILGLGASGLELVVAVLELAHALLEHAVV
jgi:hypothetical protein